MYHPFVENQRDHTRKTLFYEFKYFAKGSICKSDSHKGFFLLSTKLNTIPSTVSAVTKKTHSSSLLFYDFETNFRGASKLLLHLIYFVGFMISHPQRGADRASYIIGKSVHSQRVERLKHNVFYAVN